MPGRALATNARMNLINAVMMPPSCPTRPPFGVTVHPAGRILVVSGKRPRGTVRLSSARSERSVRHEVHKLWQRADANAVRFGIEPSSIEQHRRDAGGPRADDVHFVEIADVDRGVRVGAASLHRDLEEPRVGLLDLLDVRVEDAPHALGEAEPLGERRHRAVRVRHDHELQTEVAQCAEGGHDVTRHVVPQIEFLVVAVQLGERIRRGSAERHLRAFEDHLEIEPPALLVVGGVDRRRAIELPLGVRLGRGECRGIDVNTALAQRGGDAIPIRKHEDAAGVEEDRTKTSHMFPI